VELVQQLSEGSPVRTAIDNFGEAAKSADGQSFQVEVPKLDHDLLEVAIAWVKDHKDTPTSGDNAYDWPVDEITNERKYANLLEADKIMLENKPLEFYIPLLDAAHYLGIETLRWAVPQCIAQQLKGKSVDEMNELPERARRPEPRGEGADQEGGCVGQLLGPLDVVGSTGGGMGPSLTLDLVTVDLIVSCMGVKC